MWLNTIISFISVYLFLEPSSTVGATLYQCAFLRNNYEKDFKQDWILSKKILDIEWNLLMQSISMILSIVRDTRSRIAISVHAFELRGLISITVSEIINSNFSCKYKNIDIYSKKNHRFLRFYPWRCRSTIHERRQCTTLY